ncbi:MAG: hypothetical protein WC525_00600 [Candidatus Thermoplasmatota archaeon]
MGSKEHKGVPNFLQDSGRKDENAADEKVRKLFKPNIPQSIGKTIKKIIFGW